MRLGFAQVATGHRTLEDGQQIVIFGFGALQLPDLIAEFAQFEELIRAGVFVVTFVEDVGQLGGVCGQGHFEPNAKAICTGRFDRFLPRRIGLGRTSPGVHPPEVGIVAAGGVAIVAGGAVVVEDGVLFRSALLLVDGRITGDNPGVGAVDWVQALVGARIFFVTFVDELI